MDSVNLLKNIPSGLGDVQKASKAAGAASSAKNDEMIKVAKDFESVLIGQLMDQMKETVGKSEFQEDGSSGQIQDMFWDFLGDEVGKKGGFGMWKNIYKSMSPDGGGVKLDQSV